MKRGGTPKFLDTRKVGSEKIIVYFKTNRKVGERGGGGGGELRAPKKLNR